MPRPAHSASGWGRGRERPGDHAVRGPAGGLGRRRRRSRRRCACTAPPAPPEWMDYNDHMSESCFLLAFGDSADAFFRFLGIDEAYRAAGHSLYTSETHLHHRHEVCAGRAARDDPAAPRPRRSPVHLFHEMRHGETGVLLASAEQLLVHVDMRGGPVGATCPTQLRTRLDAIAAAHAALPPTRRGRPADGHQTPARTARTGRMGAAWTSVSTTSSARSSTRCATFVTRELYPARGGGGAADEVTAGAGRPRSGSERIEAGLHAANMPAELGGGGLDAVGMTLAERELGKASYALQWLVARPSNILQACEGDQRERYLLPAVTRRALRLPGDDRARRGLRRPVDDDAGGARRRRLRHRRHQALHQPRRQVRLRDPVRRDRHRGGARAQGQPDHRLPGRPRHPRPDRGAGPAQRLAPRLPPQRAGLRGLPGAGGQPARRGGSRLRPDGRVARARAG